MRDRGLDSRPRIKLLQNGAAEKKWTNIKIKSFHREKEPKAKSPLLVLLSWSRSVSSVPFFPKNDLMSLSSYQLSDGMRSPPTSGWPHTIFEKARKLSRGIAERFSVDSSRRAALISMKLESEESWKQQQVWEGKMVKLAEWFLTGQKGGKINSFNICGFITSSGCITSSVYSHHRWGRPAPWRPRSRPGWRSSGLGRWPSAALSDREHRHTSNTRERPRGCQTSVPPSDWSVTVKSLLKSSWVRKRRSASCRSSAGRPHSWVWRAFMAASPPSTVRNCFNMLALHTRSFSCVWAPARETWNRPEFFSC